MVILSLLSSILLTAIPSIEQSKDNYKFYINIDNDDSRNIGIETISQVRSIEDTSFLLP